MKRVRNAAAHIGLGIGAAYAFFLVPDIEALFKPEFVLVLRQGMAVGFGVCLFINPQGLSQAGIQFAPKIITVLQILFGGKNKDNEKDKI